MVTRIAEVELARIIAKSVKSGGREDSSSIVRQAAERSTIARLCHRAIVAAPRGPVNPSCDAPLRRCARHEMKLMRWISIPRRRELSGGWSTLREILPLPGRQILTHLPAPIPWLHLSKGDLSALWRQRLCVSSRAALSLLRRGDPANHEHAARRCAYVSD